VPAPVPFYDLVAIEFSNLLRPGVCSRDMGFFIGELRIPERVSRVDWEIFARDPGMPPRRLLDRVGELAGQLFDFARDSRQAFAENFGDEPVYDQLVESVRRRCQWLLDSVLV